MQLLFCKNSVKRSLPLHIAAFSLLAELMLGNQGYCKRNDTDSLCPSAKLQQGSFEWRKPPENHLICTKGLLSAH